jgi:hypothetical protein
VPLPAIPELGNAAEIRSASLVGHRLLDAGEVTPRAAAVRRLSTIFPPVNRAGAASGANDGERSDLRRSSLADHMIVDHLGAPRRAEETEDSHD